MANSIRENILVKIEAALNTISGVGTVERSRITPISESLAFPAIFLFEDREEVIINSPNAMGKVVKNLYITLQVWQMDDGSGLSTQLNELLKNVETKIMSNSQWDSLAMQTIPGESRNFINFNSTKGFGFLGFEFDIKIQYRHTFYDPETA
jgi:hypothetical protein